MPRFSKLPFLTVLLVVGLTLSSCGGEADKPLAQFKGDGFSVLMPGEPTRSEQKVEAGGTKLTIIQYISQSRDKAYAVSFVELPEGAPVDLSAVVKGAASEVKGSPQDEVKATHQGFSARDARISDAEDEKGNKGTAFMRVIKTDDRLYQLVYTQTGAKVKSPPENYQEFLKSLKVK